jgi:hypothetical protein
MVNILGNEEGPRKNCGCSVKVLSLGCPAYKQLSQLILLQIASFKRMFL